MVVDLSEKELLIKGGFPSESSNARIAAIRTRRNTFPPDLGSNSSEKNAPDGLLILLLFFTWIIKPPFLSHQNPDIDYRIAVPAAFFLVFHFLTLFEEFPDL